jgi:tetratricopeptide (TPR) repeat protein
VGAKNAFAQDARNIETLVKEYGQLTQAGKYKEALPIVKQILAIAEWAYGSNHVRTANSLLLLGQTFYRMGDYTNAQPPCLRALGLYEKAFGSDHTNTATAVSDLGVIYQAMGDYAKAEPLHLRALQIREKALGPEHRSTATSLNDLALLYSDIGGYAKAEPLFQRVLSIYEKVFGPDHTNTAVVVKDLGIVYRVMGNYTKAEPLFQRALHIREKALGGEHLDTTVSLNTLAFLYWEMGDYAKAEPLLQRALQIREKALGRDHLDTAVTLNTLALLYREMGDYTKAEPLFQRALQIREKAFRLENPNTATSLNNLALLYGEMGDYAKAEPLFQRALQLREKALGPEHPGIAIVLNNLASLYSQTDDYAKAELLYQRALQIREKALRPEHPKIVTSLDNLALLYGQMSDYAKAKPLFQRALEITEKALGPEHRRTATSLGRLAVLYRRMGDYARAEPLLQRALQTMEKGLGPEHPDTASSMNNLAILYRHMGDYAKAEILSQRALKIYEMARGPEHPSTAACLVSLALLYRDLGDYAKAEPLCQRALKIYEVARGPEHPSTAVSLNDLALLYTDMGDYGKAEPLWQRALKIEEKVLGPEHPGTAASLNGLALLYGDMGEYGKAEPLFQRAFRIFERTLGPEHPATIASLEDLARVLIDLERGSDAAVAAARAGHAELMTLANILSFAPESQRLAYTERQRLAHGGRHNPYTLLATLGDAPQIALSILRHKAVVLDSLLEDRLVAQASENEELRDAIDRLAVAKRRLTQLLLEVPKDLNEPARARRSAEREILEREVEQLEGALARQVAGFRRGTAEQDAFVWREGLLARRVTGLGLARWAFSVTVPEVQHALPRQAALIELLLYSHYLGKGRAELRYGALVLGPSGEPKWIPLGEASVIETELSRYRKAMEGRIPEKEVVTLLQALHQRLWAPIERALPAQAHTVILSPDGQLNFLSFATLLSPQDQFLGQKYSVRYVASGRDLLREMKPVVSQQSVIFGDPDFSGKGVKPLNGSTNELLAMRALDRRDLQSLSLAPLPGTANECRSLVVKAKQWSWPVQMYLGPEATEPQLQAVRSPRVLHLATHGFYLPEKDTAGSNAPSGWRGVGGIGPRIETDLLSVDSDSFRTENDASAVQGIETDLLGMDSDNLLETSVVLQNPMHRSGLALAGAQATLAAWARGETPPMDNDGIVTAEEVGGLKLRGTWLVVLSACETGKGEARSGEGVLGLRRGFIQAGAQNLLMTLWSVSDEETSKFMLDFYEAAHQSGNAPQALANVQRDWLVRVRKEHGLAEAIRIAGPFILSSQGRPQ